jgi:uncharacterized phiE125 gp8 family phage protein
MSLVQITPPAALPISLAEAKALARLDDDATDDAMIAGYIRAATSWIEQRLNRALISLVWELRVRHFPVRSDEVLRLPLPPLLSVDQITYLDALGAEQTLDPSVYVVRGIGDYGEVWRASNMSWPTVLWDAEAIRIRFTAGYGSDWSAVPEPVRHAIGGMVRGLYDGCSDGQAEELLGPYRVIAV